jgi:deoxyribose-phosphate aldolase
MDWHKLIEHTILKPDTTVEDIRRLCEEAIGHQFYGVCVPPYFVQEASRLVSFPIKIITVVGFPMGYSMIPSKVEEIKRAIDDGADEIDVVINISAVKSGHWSHIKNEIDSMSRAVSLKGKVIKLILESGLLTRSEMLQIFPIAEANDVNFITTSTGVSGSGATVEVVKFLRDNLSPKIKIKASGDIITKEQAERLLSVGADRIGVGNGTQMVLIN